LIDSITAHQLCLLKRLNVYFTRVALLQAKEKEKRYLRRRQRRAELEQKRREKSVLSENASSTAVSGNTSGLRIPFLPDVKRVF